MADAAAATAADSAADVEPYDPSGFSDLSDGSVPFRVDTRVGFALTYSRCGVGADVALRHLMGLVRSTHSIQYCKVVRELHEDDDGSGEMYHLHAILVLSGSGGGRVQLTDARARLRLAPRYFPNIKAWNGNRKQHELDIYKWSQYLEKTDPRARGDPAWFAEYGTRPERPTQKRSRPAEIDARMRECLMMDDPAVGWKAFCADYTDAALRHADRWDDAWRRLHNARTSDFEEAQLRTTNAAGAEIDVEVVDPTPEMQLWYDRFEAGAPRAILWLWSSAPGTGKSTWARSLGRHVLVSGRAPSSALNCDCEYRVFDDISTEYLRIYFDAGATNLHRRGAVGWAKVGGYQRNVRITGRPAIVCFNRHPRDVLHAADWAYWEQPASGMIVCELTRPLCRSAREFQIALGAPPDPTPGLSGAYTLLSTRTYGDQTSSTEVGSTQRLHDEFAALVAEIDDL